LTVCALTLRANVEHGVRGTKYCQRSAPAIVARSTQLGAVEHRSRKVDFAAASAGHGPPSLVKGVGGGTFGGPRPQQGRAVGVLWPRFVGSDGPTDSRPMKIAGIMAHSLALTSRTRAGCEPWCWSIAQVWGGLPCGPNDRGEAGMSGRSRLELTEVTWNPTTGCDRISAGCDHCYVLILARRLKAMGSAKYRDGDPRTSGPGFGVTTHESALTAPLPW
jgi:hypothetical protein